MIEITIGSGLAAAALAAIVLAIIVTNLNGAAWAASRLIFDIGRSGWAPRQLCRLRLDGDAATPRPAIFVLGLLLGAALLVFGAGWLDRSDLLQLAGQIFFLLYTPSNVAYLKIESRPTARVIGLISLAVCLAFAGVRRIAAYRVRRIRLVPVMRELSVAPGAERTEEFRGRQMSRGSRRATFVDRWTSRRLRGT